MSGTPRSGGMVRRIGFACAVLACVALPALVAGTQIDAAPAPGELERLRAAFDGTLGSRLAERFELATVAAADWPADDAAVATLLATARLAQVLGLFALGMLTYLATLLARGRLSAFAACIGLACLPAVMVQGHVLRPETAGTVFVGLGLVLLQCLVGAGHGRPSSRGAARRAVVQALLALSSATALGLAVGTLPSFGAALQLPLGMALLVALQVGLRGLRVGWRRGFLRLPAHATTARLWPVALAALLAFVMSLVGLHASLTVPSGDLRPSALAVTMLPGDPVAAALLQGLAVLGAAAFVLRTGVRFGRRGRAGADLVLLVFCGTQIAYGFTAGGRYDPLLAAPAIAILFGEGALGIAGFVAWVAQRRGRVNAAPRR